MRSLEVSKIPRSLIKPGRRTEAKSKVQIAFPKMVRRFINSAPLFSPRINPVRRNIAKVMVAPAVTNRTKARGRSVKSPMLSRFRENRYPTIVRISAHFPNGESEDGDKSKINPPINPSAIAPNLSSSAIKPRTTHR